ncbi:MAG: DUF1064 domain-containing protein [Oscillospiraceae bacterium]|jgi:hypothetical protein|nr:DUF1064 domain-containing protein [Oscillospiraceae bacterium]MCI2190699.1 DUF1064 domain-containing protein [Oscillospiraceae bacterium]MCI2205386.1 DUF1064 domain-containing protein [Oscillospiraceae bacterium]
MRIDDLSQLGPAVRAELERQIKERQRQNQQKEHCKPKRSDEFDSQLERNFYITDILPKILSGQIIDIELHKSFELLPKSEYCGLKLPSARYTPDFLITYRNGNIEAIETKSKAIRKLQRDYIYRRRLFIEKYCRPNGWAFREIIVD